MDTISFGAPETDVSESAGRVLVSVVRTGDLTGSITVDYHTSNGTAVSGVNYTGSTARLTFAPGQASQVISIPIIDAGLTTGNEAFGVEITAVGGGTLGFPRTTQVVIDNTGAQAGTTPDPTSNYNLTATPIVGGLNAPTAFAWVPGHADTMFIAEKSGVIRMAINGVLQSTPLLDISASVNDAQDRGLISIAVDPNFATNPYVYAYVTVDPPQTANYAAGSNAAPDGQGNRYEQLVRYTVGTVNGKMQIDPASKKILLGAAGTSLSSISGGGLVDSTSDFNQAPSGVNPDGSYVKDYLIDDSLSHTGGDLVFGPDGALYVSMGDGASFNAEDPRNVRVQDLGSLSGKVLRIDPATGLGLPDNPYFIAGQADANQSKVYQLGLRNGFRMAFDPAGHLFVGDVGWYSWEEIDTGAAGANFGWPYYEGGPNQTNLKTADYQTLAKAIAFYNANKPVVAPVQAFSHSTSQPGYTLQAIVLGAVNTGNLYPTSLAGKLFFSSLTTGQLFAIDPNNPAGPVTPVGIINGTPVEERVGPDGAIYYADISKGVIGRLDITPVVTANGTIGSGPDALVLQIQQDAYQGNAQFTVSVDGVQIGGTLTASATHASGSVDMLTVRGTFAAGAHTATVNFLNDLYGGSATQDRNLYIAGATIDGTTIPNIARELAGPGPSSFGFTAPGAAPVGTTIGAGPDRLVLRLSEDAYQGNAQYTVLIDGKQVGGTLTEAALHSAGAIDTVTVLGTFAAGSTHTAAVNFLNDLYGGSPALDRNMYIEGASINGTEITGIARELYGPGPSGFNFTSPGGPAGSSTIGSGTSKLVLQIAQDAYRGNAQYTVKIDGIQIGGTLTAQSLESSGQKDSLTVLSTLTAGPHTATVTFLNDLYGGSPALDRNLHLDGASIDGNTIGITPTTLYGPAPVSFSFISGAPPTSIGSGAHKLTLQVNEDAYKGNAQYVVKVDGTQIGGTQEATALHSSGQFNMLDVLGNFAPGAHTASVTFVNDLFDGSAAADRNLYLGGALYDGKALAVAPVELYGTGSTVNINFTA